MAKMKTEEIAILLTDLDRERELLKSLDIKPICGSQDEDLMDDSSDDDKYKEMQEGFEHDRHLENGRCD